MRGAVEAVAADLVPHVERVRDRVQVRHLRHRGVERGVEDGHLRHAGAEQLARGVDALEVRRVVQRREVDAVLDLVHDLVADHHRPRELLAAVDGAVADRVDVADRGDAGDAGLGRDEPAQHVVERGAVVAQRRRAPHRGLALDAEGDERLAADPLDHAAGELAVGVSLDRVEVGVDDLELEGGAAGVQDQYVHEPMLMAAGPRPGRVKRPSPRAPGGAHPAHSGAHGPAGRETGGRLQVAAVDPEGGRGRARGDLGDEPGPGPPSRPRCPSPRGASRRSSPAPRAGRAPGGRACRTALGRADAARAAATAPGSSVPPRAVLVLHLQVLDAAREDLPRALAGWPVLAAKRRCAPGSGSRPRSRLMRYRTTWPAREVVRGAREQAARSPGGFTMAAWPCGEGHVAVPVTPGRHRPHPRTSCSPRRRAPPPTWAATPSRSPG